ncbi:MAG: PLP-dependent cysteine synthase family protein [Lachnospiraceae bacterium]|nr:PLP-dependent cysteine synthase family protein [Lachnospiraceae bacterium]
MSENKVYKSITELVGNTPLVELGNYNKNNNLKARVLAKLEYFNPSGSVKDRAALSMILEAERDEKIKPGDTIIDFTSGNTGIALAAYANALGYKFAAILQPGVSEERTQILKAYGSIFLEFKDIPGVLELIQKEGLVFEKFYALIQKYADEHGYYYINQGRNPENPLAHYRTTGPEIWEATEGKVDYLVLLAGTGGSIVGIGKYLKEKNPDLKIIGVQPARESLKDSNFPERNTIDGVLVFHNVPKEKEILYFKEFGVTYDECIEVNADIAYETGREIVKSDGIFLGQSAAAAINAATIVAKRKEVEGKTVVAICADNAFKYLSTNIYK